MVDLILKCTGSSTNISYIEHIPLSPAAVVHFDFRAGSTFPVTVCTVPHGQSTGQVQQG